MTKDAKKAQEFYCSLFDWQIQEVPMEGGHTYRMQRIGQVSQAELVLPLRNRSTPMSPRAVSTSASKVPMTPPSIRTAKVKLPACQMINRLIVNPAIVKPSHAVAGGGSRSRSSFSHGSSRIGPASGEHARYHSGSERCRPVHAAADPALAFPGSKRRSRDDSIPVRIGSSTLGRFVEVIV